MQILGYFEEWSVRPGDRARLAISSPLGTVHARLERLISGPGDPASPRMLTEPHHEVLDTDVSVRVQSTAVGSYADLPVELPSSADLSLHLWFWATVPGLERRQVIAALGESSPVCVELVGGRLQLTGPDGSIVVDEPIAPKVWYSVVVTIAADGQGSIDLVRVVGWTAGAARWRASGRVGRFAGSGLRLATATINASGSPEQAFNGKVENPSVLDGLPSSAQAADLHADSSAGLPIRAAWDFGQRQAMQVLVSTVAGGANGTLRVGGERGCTGHSWDGRFDTFVDAPEQYAAVQFHDDDVVDAGWSYDLEFDIPADLRSGVYFVELSNGDYLDRLPLFVRGADGAKADVLFLLPTNTYQAYANEHLAQGDLSPIMSHELVLPDDEAYLFAHREFGKSTYDVHSDGTPWRFSSRRRPIINVRPGYPSWLTGSYRHFAADMYTLEWIERSGFTYHVATDEDVHQQGVELLSRYAVVVTGGHPEYWTWPGHMALKTYLASGGTLLYLGGNGFYWVTTHDPDRPWVIEVRRDNSGTRCWDAPYGERTHVYTGEPGGLWRLRGMGPNGLVGVGFSTEGFSTSRPFKRLPASYSGPAAAWFAGISTDVIGDQGYVMGAAAGDEVDRWDVNLGSPAHALVLAYADGFTNEYQLVIEDQTLALPRQGGEDRPEVVKADMTYFDIDGGGAVFAGSSIAFGAALAWNDFDNDLCTVTSRVLADFVAGRAPRTRS